MKIVRSIICLLMALFMLPACAQKEKTMDKGNGSKEKKVLVTYFSATGTTKAAAIELAKVMNADLFEIEPTEPYTDADLDWRDKSSRSSVEMADHNSRPAIKGVPENMAQYDVVFIGFPIWWYTAPTIVNTFIDSCDLNGKTLVPFATSGGSTIEKSCKDLKAACPSLDWVPGRLLNSYSTESLEKWKKSLGI